MVKDRKRLYTYCTLILLKYLNVSDKNKISMGNQENAEKGGGLLMTGSKVMQSMESSCNEEVEI